MAAEGWNLEPPTESKDEGLGLGCRAKINQPPFWASLLLFFFFLLLLLCFPSVSPEKRVGSLGSKKGALKIQERREDAISQGFRVQGILNPKP